MISPPERLFYRWASSLTWFPYNASWPIVVDLPVGTELRWRVWKAETRQQMGVQL